MNDTYASTASRPFPPASSKCNVVIYAIERKRNAARNTADPRSCRRGDRSNATTEVTQRILAEISTSATMPND